LNLITPALSVNTDTSQSISLAIVSVAARM
jgi:hypothetical protein